MPTWQQEMGWSCATCEKLNRGRFKECQNCGKPKEGEPFIDLPEEGEGVAWAVRDPELIKQATAGSDWECRFCSSHQRRDNGDCAQCGAKQGDSRSHPTKWDDGTVGPAGVGSTVLEDLQAEAQAEKTETRAEARRHRQPKAQRRQPQAREETPPPIDDISRFKDPLVSPKALVALLFAAVLGVLLFVLFRSREVEATVTALHWTNTIEVEREQIVPGHGFNEDRPFDAFDVDFQGSRHHHYKKVKTGTRKVPYSEDYKCGEDCTTTSVQCRSNSNGFKTCSGGDRVCSPKFCSRTAYRTEDTFDSVSIEEPYYTWKVRRWATNRALKAEGSTDQPYWPSEGEVHLEPPLEREQRLSSFDVTFTDASQTRHTFHPKNTNEFQQFRIGMKRRLRVGILRSTELLP